MYKKIKMNPLQTIIEQAWDSKGNPKPIEYLKTIKSVQVDE